MLAAAVNAASAAEVSDDDEPMVLLDGSDNDENDDEGALSTRAPPQPLPPRPLSWGSCNHVSGMTAGSLSLSRPSGGTVGERQRALSQTGGGSWRGMALTRAQMPPAAVVSRPSERASLASSAPPLSRPSDRSAAAPPTVRMPSGAVHMPVPVGRVLPPTTSTRPSGWAGSASMPRPTPPPTHRPCETVLFTQIAMRKRQMSDTALKALLEESHCRILELRQVRMSHPTSK